MFGDAEEGVILRRTHLPQSDMSKRHECVTDRHFFLQIILRAFCHLTPPGERDTFSLFGDSLRLVGLEAALSPKLFSKR